VSLEHTLATLQKIIDRWPDLITSRIKGTPRPTIPGTHLGDRGRERMNQQRRDDIANADDRAPGKSIAPLHIDILDLMTKLLTDAHTLANHVMQTTGQQPLPPPISTAMSPRPYLKRIIEFLPQACADDEDMLEAITEKADLIHDEILMALGEVFDGQRLNAVCPFCMGQTSKRLAGELTMRVRIRDIGTNEHPNLAEFLVVCENPDGMCQPFAREVDTWVGTNPAWRYPRWPWLAKQLHTARRAG